MSTTTMNSHSSHADAHGHDGHDHETTDRTVFGFWIYIMSDCLLFSALFATFAVLSHSFAGGPTGRDIFELPYVLVETFALLISSVTYGFAILAMHKSNKAQVQFWLIVTFICGAIFIGMEVNEFHKLILEGHGPQRSAFLSAFFTLVGTHGIHVTSGLIWMASLFIRISKRGLDGTSKRRLMCLSLFWHFLDVVWIGVFTVVYLLGVL